MNGALLAIFIALITGLITMAITWLVDAANNIVLGVLDTGLISFRSSGNLLSVFEDLFNNYNLKVGNNLAQIIMYASLFLILLLTIFEVINSMTAGLQGERAENPLKILARGVVTLVLELIIFGIPFNGTGHIQGADAGETVTEPIYAVTPGKACYLVDSSGTYKLQSSTKNCDDHIGGTSYGYVYKEDFRAITGYKEVDKTAYFSTGENASLMSAFGAAMSSILDLVFGSIDFSDYKLSGLGKWQASLDVPRLIVLIILQISLFKSVIQMAIVFIERYLSFAFYILMGPLAVACNATTKTKSTYHDWLMGILSQFLTIFVSLAALRMYLSCWNSWAGTDPLSDPKKFVTESVAGVFQINGSVIVHYCICLALISLVTNSEKIVNALGFKTIMNGDTARSWGAGAMMFGRYFGMTAGRALRNGASLVGNKMLHSAAVSSNRAGQTGLGNRALNFIDPYKNTQMGMDGNKFKTSTYAKNNYTWDKHSQRLSYLGDKPEKAKYAEARKAINDFYSGKTNTIDMKKAAPFLALDSVGNVEHTKTGYAVDIDGKRQIAFGAKMKDSNGQMHAYGMITSMDDTQHKTGKLVSHQNSVTGLKTDAFEINSYMGTTDNGVSYYRIDKSDLVSSKAFGNEVCIKDEEGHYVTRSQAFFGEEFDEDSENESVNYDTYRDTQLHTQQMFDDILNNSNAYIRSESDLGFDKIRELGIGETVQQTGERGKKMKNGPIYDYRSEDISDNVDNAKESIKFSESAQTPNNEDYAKELSGALKKIDELTNSGKK